MEEEEGHLGSYLVQGDRVTKHVHGAGGGDPGRLVTCRRIDPVSQYVNNGSLAFQCQRKEVWREKGRKGEWTHGAELEVEEPSELLPDSM